MYHENDIDHRIKDCLIFLEAKRKMTQKQNQPLTVSPAKEVNHITHWQQPPLQPNCPSYPSLHSRQEHPATYQGQPLSYYQSYHYAATKNQTHTTPLPITYPPPSPQITCPMSNTPSHQSKSETNALPPPPTQQQEPLHQSNNFPTYGTIHTITGGSNLDFQNKR
jgi:hypothetical protein